MIFYSLTFVGAPREMLIRKCRVYRERLTCIYNPVSLSTGT